MANSYADCISSLLQGWHVYSVSIGDTAVAKDIELNQYYDALVPEVLDVNGNTPEHAQHRQRILDLLLDRIQNFGVSTSLNPGGVGMDASAPTLRSLLQEENIGSLFRQDCRGKILSAANGVLTALESDYSPDSVDLNELCKARQNSLMSENDQVASNIQAVLEYLIQQVLVKGNMSPEDNALLLGSLIGGNSVPVATTTSAPTSAPDVTSALESEWEVWDIPPDSWKRKDIPKQDIYEKSLTKVTTFGTIGKFWETCRILRAPPFAPKTNSFMMRSDHKPLLEGKFKGGGRIRWRCKKANTPHVWWNTLLALVGEVWTDEVKTHRNRIMGFEWKDGRDDMDNFSLWHLDGPNGEDIVGPLTKVLSSLFETDDLKLRNESS